MKELFDDLLLFINHDNQTNKINRSINWDNIYAIAKEQGILAIVWDGVQNLCKRGIISQNNMPPKSLKIQWALSVEKITNRYLKQQNIIEKLSAFYSDHNIRMMLLKGYGLSLLYDCPEYRECGDIDIWLYGDQKRADKIIEYEKNIKVDVDRHHHTTFIINGTMVENHFNFLNIYAHRSNRYIEKELLRLSENENSIKIKVGNSDVFLPSPNLNALFLLRHSAVHFAAVSIKLRHILDWAKFIIRYHNEIDWKWLFKISEQYNMHQFLYGINSIVIKYFGVSQDMIPHFPCNSKLEDRILNDILSQDECISELQNRYLLSRVLFRFRRWWRNRWKHRIVYNEGLIQTFFTQVYSHLLKPKSLK